MNTYRKTNKIQARGEQVASKAAKKKSKPQARQLKLAGIDGQRGYAASGLLDHSLGSEIAMKRASNAAFDFKASALPQFHCE